MYKLIYIISLRRIRRKFNCSKDLTNEMNSIDISQTLIWWNLFFKSS